MILPWNEEVGTLRRHLGALATLVARTTHSGIQVSAPSSRRRCCHRRRRPLPRLGALRGQGASTCGAAMDVIMGARPLGAAAAHLAAVRQARRRRPGRHGGIAGAVRALVAAGCDLDGGASGDAPAEPPNPAAERRRLGAPPARLAARAHASRSRRSDDGQRGAERRAGWEERARRELAGRAFRPAGGAAGRPSETASRATTTATVVVGGRTSTPH